MMKKTIAISIVVIAIFVTGLTPTVSADEVNFSQLDFYLDGNSTLNSDWGSVELTFEGSDDILYFNLVVNGNWQIQNVPVLSLKGTGPQSQRFSFDLGNNVGVDVTAINYALNLTTYTLASAPSGSTPATVGDDQIVLFSGGRDVSLPVAPAPAVPLVGGQAVNNEQHKNENFPNQECGNNECAPTAVSNSLQFLNDKHNLGMNPDDIDIETMKDATGWAPDGCFIWGPNAFPALKDAYMKANGYPITTRVFQPNQIGALIAEIDDDQDIEAELDGHTVCVVGITDLGGGRYSVTVASDVDQDDPNGGAGEEGIETGTWNTNTGTWEGGFGGYGLNYFVVECPIKEFPALTPPGFLLALVALLGLAVIVTRKMHKR